MFKEIIFIVFSVLCIFTSSSLFAPWIKAYSNPDRWWEIQSVDTMKLSRDLAREKLNDDAFEIVIEEEVSRIASLGATHVAIGTPYDVEFLPFIQKWVEAARRNGLNVWFRGNFSGWEEWYGYPSITTAEHKNLLAQFISNNSNLFENGDIITPCPECENGAIGDPRSTVNVEDFRDFLVEEYKICNFEMQKLNKIVQCGFFSMNGDVAELVMNKDTAASLGGFVVIDHYTQTPEDLLTFIKDIKDQTDSKIVLGEIGVPIFDIHGRMSEFDQSEWIIDALSALSQNDVIYGINYWVSTGGSTALWRDDGSEKPARYAVDSFYSPEVVNCKVVDERGRGLSNAIVEYKGYEFYSNEDGFVELILDPSLNEFTVYKDKYNKVSSSTEYCEAIKLERSNVLLKNIVFLYRWLLNIVVGTK